MILKSLQNHVLPTEPMLVKNQDQFWALVGIYGDEEKQFIEPLYKYYKSLILAMKDHNNISAVNEVCKEINQWQSKANIAMLPVNGDYGDYGGAASDDGKVDSGVHIADGKVDSGVHVGDDKENRLPEAEEKNTALDHDEEEEEGKKLSDAFYDSPPPVLHGTAAAAKYDQTMHHLVYTDADVSFKDKCLWLRLRVDLIETMIQV